MLNIARRCVPYTPFDKDLSTAVVTLVSATGVYAPGQDPFPTEDPGDVSYRPIGAAAQTSTRSTKPGRKSGSAVDETIMMRSTLAASFLSITF